MAQKVISMLNGQQYLFLHLQDATTEESGFGVDLEVPSTSSQSPVKAKSTEFIQPSLSPKKRKMITAADEPGSGSESSSLPSPASQISDIKLSSGSDSSASRKRKRCKLEHSYA